MSYAIAQNNPVSSRQAQVPSSLRRRLAALALIAVVLASLVVVLGAFTRLKHAGLGCPDWPGCYGHLTWPDSHEEVAAAEARFPEAPVEHNKTWPEMVHRYFAGALGLLIFAQFIMVARARKNEPDLPIKLPLAICFMVVLQAAFGMWTVTLKLWPQVVTAHLLGGFTTLSLLWLYYIRLGYAPWRSAPASVYRLRYFALLALAVCVLQVALGGWTSANYAALACTDLPTCHGAYWPQVDFAQGFNFFQEVGPNYLGGLLDSEARTAIHLSHRLGALVVSVTLCALAVLLWRSGFAPARKLAAAVLAVLFVQLCLGLSNIYFGLPLAVAVAHNAVGAGLILVMVMVNQRLFTIRHSQELV